MSYIEVKVTPQCLKRLLTNHSISVEELHCVTPQTKQFIKYILLEELKGTAYQRSGTQ